MNTDQKFTVIKHNPQGEETWRYQGRLVERGEETIVIEAHFDRGDMEFHGMQLCKGDRFVETYYRQRWYNIFAIHDREDDHLKGWYCNIATPAVIEDSRILYRDLALDLLVFPDGRQLVLDEDEFADLSISEEKRAKARAALAELRTLFRTNRQDFHWDEPLQHD